MVVSHDTTAYHRITMSTAAPVENYRPHTSHWGAFRARTENGELVVESYARDPDPSPILQNIPAALTSPARVARPAVRRGWLENGPKSSSRRGRDEFVEVSWEKAFELVAGELKRVREAHGPEALYAGSYGWASAGCFHTAQSQLHRLLNLHGGFVKSVNSYSAGCATVLLPRILGNYDQVSQRNVTWPSIVEHTELIVAFGGMALKNSAVGGGNVGRHVVRENLMAAHKRGCRFLLVSPLRDDFPAEAEADWQTIVPGTDTALMLGIAHTLVSEKLHDRDFLARYCVGFAEFEAYLMGAKDGEAKDPAWAAAICGIPVDRIRALARQMAGRRTLITVSQSMQRAEHGEQPIWMAVTLAAMLGQIGLPGGGFFYAIGSMANIGKLVVDAPVPNFPKGRNPITRYIPVARISDMLLNPGQPYDYDGHKLVYPDIRIVYWVGGNPFHHHQDLNRLRRAFARPETIIVHECAWTATARHADIVLPSTVTMEREDIGASPNDPLISAMHRLAEPYAEARDDFAICSGIARHLGLEKEFTDGRDAKAWIRHIYDTARAQWTQRKIATPDFDTFWEEGELELPVVADTGGLIASFRENPEKSPLMTPSGKVEIFSETIAGFGYDDCPGHPVWLPWVEGAGSAMQKRFPLFLISNQPATRLHSQLDFGAHSQASKIKGREPVRLNPADAAARGVRDGDVVRLFNDRGSCLAGAVLSEEVGPGVVQLSTGAWYDPDDRESEQALCVHGNPNVLTRDAGTSRLTQGCTGQLTLVDFERYAGALPPIRAFQPPVALP
jgi:biotin/methionine sulfoxide reductase